MSPGRAGLHRSTRDRAYAYRRPRHDSCGAVNAALAAINDGTLPGGYVRDVERAAPSVLLAAVTARAADEFGATTCTW